MERGQRRFPVRAWGCAISGCSQVGPPGESVDSATVMWTMLPGIGRREAMEWLDSALQPHCRPSRRRDLGGKWCPTPPVRVRHVSCDVLLPDTTAGHFGEFHDTTGPLVSLLIGRFVPHRYLPIAPGQSSVVSPAPTFPWAATCPLRSVC